MNQEEQLKFQSDFPLFFVDLNGDPQKTGMSAAHGGIAIGDGWGGLLCKLCEDLAKVAGSEFKFVQIKEKFGQLRIYANGGNAETNQLIDKAEEDSASICESCGSTEGVTMEGRWIKALCKNCRKHSFSV
jgi:hypothetical protein